MKKFAAMFILTLVIMFSSLSHAQEKSYGNYVVINPGDTPEQIIEKAANVTPAPRQYEWQKMELTAFIHFGINTFYDAEWGHRGMDITKFNPTELDAKQWVKVLKDAGIKQIIITAKHHDGFCLWPTKYSDYTIAHTPFQNGKGDIVRDLSNACHEAGIKFGVYLSPWDMNEKKYGTPEYNTYFMKLLTELLTNYGEISEVWFDGANGEGPNGKKQVYDWHAYYDLIRKLQPDAVIAIMGPDARWVGTESGYGRETEWSVLPGSSANQDEIAANSQQKALDKAFVPQDLTDQDLGSRKKIEKATSLIWYPAEVDVSIRPGWFYHKHDDDHVKTPYKLVDIYYNSVGMNGLLLLNVPPDKRGLITDYDIKSLQGMRHILDATFTNNLASNAKVSATDEKDGNKAANILDNDLTTYWTTSGNNDKASIELTFDKETTFNRAMLQENILVGQRVEKFHLERWDGKQWLQFTGGTTVGNKRLLRFPEVTTSRVKITIDECRTNPTLASFGLYMAPPEVTVEPNGASFADSVHIKIDCDVKGTKIYYTTDGSNPTKSSSEYTGDVLLTKTAEVKVIAISNDGKVSYPVSAIFGKAKYGIELKTQYDKKYPGAGIYNLVDGITGSSNFNDGRWQGYNGDDLDVIIDLGNVKPINKISARFMQDVNSYLFLPEYVEYSVSDNGIDYKTLEKVTGDTTQAYDLPLIKSYEVSPQNISGRYIHVKAKNIGICPPWHKGAGEKAWLFADEISVE